MLSPSNFTYTKHKKRNIYMAKKKKETANSKNVSFSEAIGVSSFIHNEKTNVTVGLILFGISIFMFWSFCSFFSTGQNDQSIITNPLPEIGRAHV